MLNIIKFNCSYASYVDKHHPNTNFLKSDSLVTGVINSRKLGFNLYKSILNFDIPDLNPNSIKSAFLFLFVENMQFRNNLYDNIKICGHFGNVNVETVNWKSFPIENFTKQLILNISKDSARSYIKIDITSIIKSLCKYDVNYNLVLSPTKTNSTTILKFSSNNSKRPPYLEIETMDNEENSESNVDDVDDSNYIEKNEKHASESNNIENENHTSDSENADNEGYASDSDKVDNENYASDSDNIDNENLIILPDNINAPDFIGDESDEPYANENDEKESPNIDSTLDSTTNTNDADAINENIADKIMTYLENDSKLLNNINENNTYAKIIEDNAEIKNVLIQITSKLNAQSSILDSVKYDIDTNSPSKDLAILKKLLNNMSNVLDSHDKKISNINTISKNNFSSLANTLNGINVKISSIESNSETLTTTLSELNEDFISLNSDVLKLRSMVYPLSENIENLKSTMEDLKDSFNNMNNNNPTPQFKPVIEMPNMDKITDQLSSLSQNVNKVMDTINSIVIEPLD